MSTKLTYCKIFGLHENASKDEIRRAYRKLAMKYHPDKNSDPKAHQVFIDLAEAYDILMNDRFETKSSESKIRKEKTFEERKKEAEIRYKQQKAKEEQEQNFYFQKLTSDKKWNIFKKMAYFSALFSFLLLIEPILPTHVENHTITHYSYIYNGFFGGEVIYFKTEKDLNLFIKNPHLTFCSTNPELAIERSWIFYNPLRVWSKNSYLKSPYETDFSVNTAFPIIPILLLLPIITLYFKRQSLYFTIAYFFSFYFIGGFFLYFILSQDRWIHFLSLGIL